MRRMAVKWFKTVMKLALPRSNLKSLLIECVNIMCMEALVLRNTLETREDHLRHDMFAKFRTKDVVQ